jgi:aarF domain-containing kinase
MYPEVEQLFRGDVRTIKMFAQIAQPVHVPPLDEVEKQFMTEFDYRREAETMESVRNNLNKAGLAGTKRKLCQVPKPFMNLCTKRVLVMEELKGSKLPDSLEKDGQRHASRLGITFDELKREEEKKTRDLKKQGIVRKGPSTKEYEQYITLLDGKRRLANASAAFYNYSIGWLPMFQRKSYIGRNTLPINHAKIIDDLIYIHGHEILVDGEFNGDPHPGNVLLLGLEEGRPQIGLIDYGQVKKISKEERLRLCKIIVALADDNRPEVVRLVKEAGFISKSMNAEVIYKFAKVSYDEDNFLLTDGKHIQLYMDDLFAQDPVEELPTNYIMVGRTSVILRGLAHALNQSRSLAKEWRPIAVSELKKDGCM